MIQKDTKTIPFSTRFRQTLPREMLEPVYERFAVLFVNFELPANAKLRYHLSEMIIPGLAYYQLLREGGLSQEQALAQFDQVCDQIGVLGFRNMSRLGRLPFVYPLLRVSIKPFMGKFPPAGWQIEWVENSAEAVRFNMRSCFYHETLTRLGAPELTASFCRIDDLVYEKMSPYLIWRRTQTIARGAVYCDFCFAPAEKK
jgi:hypothetical protein